VDLPGVRLTCAGLTTVNSEIQIFKDFGRGCVCNRDFFIKITRVHKSKDHFTNSSVTDKIKMLFFALNKHPETIMLQPSVLKKRVFYPAFLASISLLFANCATICGGSKYYAHVVVNDKPNAKIMYDGAFEGAGKAVISVRRKDAKRFSFTVQQEGCAEQHYRFRSRTFRGWALGGTVITWTYVVIPIGLVVDLATGALWKPNVYEKGIKKMDFKNFRYNVDYTATCKTETKTPAATTLKKEIQTDVIYLKNGNTVKGTIIENIPGDRIQIRIPDGDIILYKADEIDRITNESVTE
jgi:hypothetical protein